LPGRAPAPEPRPRDQPDRGCSGGPRSARRGAAGEPATPGSARGRREAAERSASTSPPEAGAAAAEAGTGEAAAAASSSDNVKVLPARSRNDRFVGEGGGPARRPPPPPPPPPPPAPAGPPPPRPPRPPAPRPPPLQRLLQQMTRVSSERAAASVCFRACAPCQHPLNLQSRTSAAGRRDGLVQPVTAWGRARPGRDPHQARHAGRGGRRCARWPPCGVSNGLHRCPACGLDQRAKPCTRLAATLSSLERRVSLTARGRGCFQCGRRCLARTVEQTQACLNRAYFKAPAVVALQWHAAHMHGARVQAKQGPSDQRAALRRRGRAGAGPACLEQRSGQALEADGAGHEPRRRDTLQFDAVLGADAAQDDVFQRAPWQRPVPEGARGGTWAAGRRALVARVC